MKNTADEVIAQLLGDKKLNLQKGNSEAFNYTRIPFGIPALDKLTGGGIPKKRMTIMYGPTNVGKSYLASQVVANVQREGGTAAWIDTELSWDAEWVEKCGIDSERMMVSQPTSGEEALGTAKELMRAGVDIIVLDSIAGLVPSDVQDNEKGFEFSPMAWQARFVNSALPRLLPNLKSGSAFIAINQVRSSIGPVALDTMPGGLAQGFFAHFLLQVRRSGWIEEGKGNKVGFDMEVRLRKSKVGGENWSNAIVPFRVDGGIDILESYIREAIQQKLIIQKGPWYDYEGTKAMGMNGLKDQFLKDTDLLEKLKACVT
tara:strand:- start:8892 stop:9839 length:948 start_codon:yes stop_codon:yes gene_type:complete